jgi:alpha,alpha-trehalase
VTRWSDWSLTYEEFQPDRQRLREALCTLGNGYFATRGAAEEAVADDVHYPGTYLAGGYNRLRTGLAGREIEHEDLVNLPNWLALKIRIGDGSWFDLKTVELLAYRQELDLKRGLLMRRVQLRDSQGRRSTLSSRRLIHMRDRHLAALEVTLTADDWTGPVVIRSALDGRVVNAGVERYRDLHNDHLDPVTAEVLGPEVMCLKVRTKQSELVVAEAARNRLVQGGQRLAVEPRAINEPGYIAHEFALDLAQGESVSLEKVVALYCSRDHAIADCGLEAQTAIARAPGFSDVLETHVETWRYLWERFGMDIEPEPAQPAQRSAAVLRLHIFHLLQTCSPHVIDLDVGAPARGLHGEAYRGHIFWDELFIFPLLNFRMPEITRALLRYRYRRLREARAAAREAGYRGAMYPWQSGSNGREETPMLHLNPRSARWVPDNSHRQRHVNSAIAYDIWQYYQTTGDMEFLSFYGAEMMLEIARFWASVATYREDLERYEILGVMGPDEYHDGYPDGNRFAGARPALNNNAYTNLMAAWVLWRALDVLDVLPEDRRAELCDTVDLGPDERSHWDRVSRTMRVVFHGDGIISQFEGYDELEEFNWVDYRKKYGDIQRLDRILEAEGDSPNRYKLSKQADVLMLFYLFSSEELRELFERLGYPFEYETIPKNIEYYLKRTSHGSTLSRVAHSWVLARGDRPGSWDLFREALDSDVADIQGGTTAEGIHLGAMAGTVDMIQRGYTGLEVRADALWLNPRLPEPVAGLRMQVRYRGHSLDLQFGKRTVTVCACRALAAPIQIGIKGALHTIKGGETHEFPL